MSPVAAPTLELDEGLFGTTWTAWAAGRGPGGSPPVGTGFGDYRPPGWVRVLVILVVVVAAVGGLIGIVR